MNQEVTLIMRFTVDESGKTTDFKMDPGSGNVEFDDMLIQAAKWVKDKWKPATLHGVNIKLDLDSQLLWEIITDKPNTKI